jgi:internalin A
VYARDMSRVVKGSIPRGPRLNTKTQKKIDDVLAGHSTTLWIEEYSNNLEELPQQVRKLTGLRSLNLTGSNIRKLPPWLVELPNLEEITLADSKTFDLPSSLPSSLPNVRWSLSAELSLKLSDRIDPRKIFEITVDDDHPSAAIQYIFDAAGNGALDLSKFSIETYVLFPPDRDRVHAQWDDDDELFTVIDSGLDEFLDSQRRLRYLSLLGLPIGRTPEPIHHLRTLDHLRLSGMWAAPIPDWLFEASELKSLSLGLNSISDLPDSLGNARHLEYLDLTYNPLRRVPSGVWNLAALESLDLSNCPIEEIPADILRLERLSSLILGSYGTVSVPKILLSPGPRELLPRVPRELLSPPPEIGAQGLEAIKRYWSQKRDAGVD